MSLHLRAAVCGLRLAEQHLERTLAEGWPIGSFVHWERCGRLHAGVVRGHGLSTRLLVRNTLTRAEYWINADDILRAFEREMSADA